MKNDMVIEIVKATPPTSLSALILMGYPLSDWVFVLGAVLLVLQLYFLIRDKLWRQRGRKD